MYVIMERGREREEKRKECLNYYVFCILNVWTDSEKDP